MATPPHLPLKAYVLSRWLCLRHGWFETGTIIAQHAQECPKCKMPAEFVRCCQGLTSSSLPFTTTPRLSESGVDSVMGHHQDSRDGAARRRGLGKATRAAASKKRAEKLRRQDAPKE